MTEKIGLDDFAQMMHYSKYHLHRMFTNIVGFTIHKYIQRRRLTEAAKLLVFTDRNIIDIALIAGYESQQAFTTAFKLLYKKSPRIFRECKEYYPLQLKFALDDLQTSLYATRIMDIRIQEYGQIYLIGYYTNTKNGFTSIDKCWTRLHKEKEKIHNRVNFDYLIGIHDYSEDFSYDMDRPRPIHYATAEVKNFTDLPKNMVAKIIPPNKYVIFTYLGKIQDHIYPIMNYIYRIWFAQSTSQLNDSAKYDLVRYGEKIDETGMSKIEVWIPIL